MFLVFCKQPALNGWFLSCIAMWAVFKTPLGWWFVPEFYYPIYWGLLHNHRGIPINQQGFNGMREWFGTLLMLFHDSFQDFPMTVDFPWMFPHFSSSHIISRWFSSSPMILSSIERIFPWFSHGFPAVFPPTKNLLSTSQPTTRPEAAPGTAALCPAGLHLWRRRVRFFRWIHVGAGGGFVGCSLWWLNIAAETHLF